MGAVEDSQDATLGALGTRDPAAPLHFDEDVVAVHGILDAVARDVDVAIKLGDRSIGNHKAVAVRMEDEPALQFVAIGPSGLQMLLAAARPHKLLVAGGPVLPAPRQAITAPGQFLDGAAFLELGEHFMERPRVDLPELQALGDLARGRGAAPKL